MRAKAAQKAKREWAALGQSVKARAGDGQSMSQPESQSQPEPVIGAQAFRREAEVLAGDRREQSGGRRVLLGARGRRWACSGVVFKG